MLTAIYLFKISKKEQSLPQKSTAKYMKLSAEVQELEPWRNDK